MVCIYIIRSASDCINLVKCEFLLAIAFKRTFCGFWAMLLYTKSNEAASCQSLFKCVIGVGRGFWIAKSLVSCANGSLEVFLSNRFFRFEDGGCFFQV
jgi:hypothetical protein